MIPKMVLTDKQRSDLHGGIHAYLLSRGGPFAAAAAALADADPGACAPAAGGDGASPAATLLEKKWTAVPRLQRRVLELERQLAASSRRSGHRPGDGGGDNGAGGTGRPGPGRRMLPRPGRSTPLKSHSSAVTSAAVHPDYTLAASGSDDGTVKLWDHEGGEYLRTLKGHTNAVTCVDFSPSGGYLASSSADLSVKVWSVKDGEYACVRTLRGHDHTVSAVRFVPPEAGDVFLDGGRGGKGASGGGRKRGAAHHHRRRADPAQPAGRSDGPRVLCLRRTRGE